MTRSYPLGIDVKLFLPTPPVADLPPPPTDERWGLGMYLPISLDPIKSSFIDNTFVPFTHKFACNDIGVRVFGKGGEGRKTWMMDEFPQVRHDEWDIYARQRWASRHLLLLILELLEFWPWLLLSLSVSGQNIMGIYITPLALIQVTEKKKRHKILYVTLWQLVADITADCNVTKLELYSWLFFDKELLQTRFCSLKPAVISITDSCMQHFVYNHKIGSKSTLWYIYLLCFVHWLTMEYYRSFYVSVSPFLLSNTISLPIQTSFVSPNLMCGRWKKKEPEPGYMATLTIGIISQKQWCKICLKSTNVMKQLTD